MNTLREWWVAEYTKKDIRNRLIASTYYFTGLKIGRRVEGNNMAQDRVESLEPVEKVIFCRLIKNVRMQGARNPESGVATSKERLLATPASW
jgi:hypothetical protein